MFDEYSSYSEIGIVAESSTTLEKRRLVKQKKIRETRGTKRNRVIDGTTFST